MDYPTFTDSTELTTREKQTFCLGAIAEMESILCGQLRDAVQAVTGQSREDRLRSRKNSGACVRQLIEAMGDTRYDWIDEARSALLRIQDAVDKRNEALHSEWLHRGEAFTHPLLIDEGKADRQLEHFESIHHDLDIAADNAVGISTLLRFTELRERGEQPHPRIEQINRALIAKLP